ncbi:MAG: hypothetical protein ABEJ23_04650 [Haloarculaceae archaeon]
MPSRWWYASATGAALAAVDLALAFAVQPSAQTGVAADAVAVAFLLGSLLVPVGTVLDVRSLDASVPWQPSGWRWGLASLVPVLNVSVAVAYCVRRSAAVRGTVPGAHWQSVVGVGALAWAGAFAIEVALDHVSLSFLDALFGPLFVLGLFVAPVAVYLDAAHVRGYTDWHPRAAAWAIGAGVPYLGALVCLGFLVRRRRAFVAADDPETVSLPAVEAATAAPSSPWFRGAGALFAVHFLAVVALAAGTSLSGTAVEVAALLLWLPFGPVFAGCVFLDARWRRAHDRAVGDRWFLYLLSVVVQAAAFWYLVRRATSRARTRAAANTESG